MFNHLRKGITKLPPLNDITSTSEITVNNQKYSIRYCLDDDEETLCGLLFATRSDPEFRLYTLCQALNIIFTKDCCGCLIVLSEYTIAVLRCDGVYFAYDSHSRDKDGMLSECGTSTLVCLGSELPHVVQFIIRLAQSLHLKRTTQFEMVGVLCNSLPGNVDQDMPDDSPASSGKTDCC